MNIDEHINQFNDWSFSTGRPKFADEFGTEEHTRFCLEFIKRQLSGGDGLTGPLAVFFGDLADVSDLYGYEDVRFLMGYYIYMNTLRGGDWTMYQEIKIDSERIRRIMVLA